VTTNAAAVAGLVRRAADAGAHLVVLPEKFLSGYEPDLIRSDPRTYTVTMDDPRLDPIAQACRETATAAVVGAAARSGDQSGAERLFISALVFASDGALLTRYDKQYLFGSERKIFQAGAAGCTIELRGWRLALGICYDAGFPEHARAAALDGCDAYFVGGLFSTGNGYHESRTWFPARALDNTCYTLLSNHVGRTGGWNACGGSGIWAPDGRLLAEAGPDETGFAVADLDAGRLATVRAAETMLRDLAESAGSPLTRRACHRLD
jgi:predicted amidohydrolase